MMKVTAGTTIIIACTEHLLLSGKCCKMFKQCHEDISENRTKSISKQHSVETNITAIQVFERTFVLYFNNIKRKTSICPLQLFPILIFFNNNPGLLCPKLKSNRIGNVYYFAALDVLNNHKPSTTKIQKLLMSNVLFIVRSSH